MKLTPREPTPSMLSAGGVVDATPDKLLRLIWRAMHDAAPSAEPVADEPVAERGEYPPDAVIAQCMLAVDDPLLWGRLGGNNGDMVRKFARAVIDADRAQRAKP